MANKYTNERYREITAYLKDHEKASVEELSELLFVSPATIRRDLSDMQKLGMIQRTHGGAMLLDNINELNIFVRIEKNAKEKQHTATVALNHLPQFNTVFIDNSSTCLVLAQRIDFQYKRTRNGRLIILHYDRERDSSDSKNTSEVTVNKLIQKV